MATCIVFDGNSILNRAFYGIRPLTNQAGLPTNALFGFVNMIRRAMEETDHPEYAAIAFDLKAPTFRHKACDFYKATRHGMPDDLARQMPYAKRLAEALGLHVLEIEGYEADDILGTISHLFSENHETCVLVTGDRDSYQLVDENVTVHLAATNETRIIGVKEIGELYGVSPRQLIDVKAIMGDTSDNIPGVPGIGEKGAVKLIAEYHSLDGVYEHLEEIGGANHTKLVDGKESAYTSRFLAEICLTVPLSRNPEDYRFKGPDVAGLRELYTELEFRKFLEQLDEGADAEESAAEQRKEYAAGCASDLQGGEIAVYPEENGLYTYGEKGAVLLPWQEAAKVDWSAEGLTGRKIFAWSVKDLLHAFWENGINADLSGCVEDLSLMAYVIAPSDNGTTFAGAYFRCFAKNFIGNPDPAVFAEMFACLQKQMGDAVNRLYREIELPLAFVLADMEHVGFCLDADGLKKFTKNLEEEIALCEESIYQMAGHEFNLNSPKQLGVVLFEERNLPHYKKTKSGYSTDAETLEKLASYDPLVERILDYRKAAKLKSTYGDGLLKVVSPDGRVHTTFKQTMTMTGRLSSAEPNLQNIPVRTEKGRALRGFFVAEEGWTLIDADYSQIELRLLAHISGDEHLIEAFRNGEDIHTATASQVFAVDPEDVTKEMRKFAKTINFGIIYGMGDYSLSQDLGISVAKAKGYIQSYFAKYPSIQSYLESCKQFAAENGYVETLFGRRREIPEMREKNKIRRAFGERVAMNTPIQGTAADLIKKAMIAVSERLKREGLRARLVLQIHDELIVEAPLEEVDIAKQILEEEMSGVMKLSVPLIAEAGCGKNWLEAKD